MVCCLLKIPTLPPALTMQCQSSIPVVNGQLLLNSSVLPRSKQA